MFKDRFARLVEMFSEPSTYAALAGIFVAVGQGFPELSPLMTKLAVVCGALGVAGKEKTAP